MLEPQKERRRRCDTRDQYQAHDSCYLSFLEMFFLHIDPGDLGPTPASCVCRCLCSMLMGSTLPTHSLRERVSLNGTRTVWYPFLADALLNLALHGSGWESIPGAEIYHIMDPFIKVATWVSCESASCQSHGCFCIHVTTADRPR